MKRQSTLLIFLILVAAPMVMLGAGNTAAQSASTPTVNPTPVQRIPSELPVITAANADRLSQIAVLSPGQVHGAEWSRDSATLAVYGQEGIWLYAASDLANPRFLQSDIGVENVVFSLDEHSLASEEVSENSYLRGVRLWNVVTGEAQAPFLPNVTAPAFTADADTLIVRDRSAPRLLFWSISQSRYRAALGDAYLAVVSPDGRFVACAEGNPDSGISRITLRDSQTTRIIRVLSDYNRPISTLAFSPSGKLLAAVDKYGVMKVREVATGQLQHTPGAETYWEENTKFGVSFSSDGTLIGLVAIPLGHQAWATVWEVSTGRYLDGFLTDYGSTIYFVGKTVLVIQDDRNAYTFLRGIEGSDGLKQLENLTFPQLNLAQTLITFSSYDSQGVFLYAVH
jgi:hypothetical protein